MKKLIATIVEWYKEPTTANTPVVTLLLAVFFTLTSNVTFFMQALHAMDWMQPTTWLFAVCIGLIVLGLNLVLLSLLLWDWTARWLTPILLIATAFFVHLMMRFGVMINTGLMREMFETDWTHTRDVWSWGLALHVLLAGVLPAWLLMHTGMHNMSWLRAMMYKTAVVLLGGLLISLGAVPIFSQLQQTLRHNQYLPYTLAPLNYVSTASVIALEKLRLIPYRLLERMHEGIDQEIKRSSATDEPASAVKPKK